ncbi:hypothetical protein KR093_006699 [Drosophila rubida]|uniref:Platelet-derived growth factor (PDGF) family profile domain-containing protein n=1 Tax=Drosophila rubida TaxID=30044 RepID=A0AAD4KAJ0_9MUSC|nr:hypothetical protein KR093_006699 [Drosophila rubida]
MTRTQHTTRSCKSSSNDLQHAQQRRRRQMSTQLQALMLFVLISCSAAATAQSRYYYTSATDAQQGKVRTQRQASDDGAVTDETADSASCCQGAAAAGAEPVTLSLELSNVTTESNSRGKINAQCFTDLVTTNASPLSAEQFKRSADQPPLAMPAICSPQPTIVELTVAQEAEQTGGNVRYSPACTRVNRCSGCCGSTLIACQPTVTEALQMRVRKLGSKKKEYVIVTVEQHVACKCDCRIRAEDCNTYQEYRKDLCRCECQNTDARDKCLEQSENKYWDDANCTCACRYNQSCTTGTIFDESQCKCTDPSAPSDFTDRRRFIVQAIPVEQDNSTLYTV